MRPEYLVLGDSHSNALVEGLIAHGKTTEMLRFSGNYWHNGEIVQHDTYGIWSRSKRWPRGQISQLAQRMGEATVITPSVPVVATFGYHLGRLVSPLQTTDHVADADEFAANPQAQFVSQGFVQHYVTQFRSPLIRAARRISRRAPLLLVAPPVLPANATARVFHAEITRQMRNSGMVVFDPNTQFLDPDQPFPPDWITPDNAHGNAAYGTALVGALIDQGLLPKF